MLAPLPLPLIDLPWWLKFINDVRTCRANTTCGRFVGRRAARSDIFTYISICYDPSLEHEARFILQTYLNETNRIFLRPCRKSVIGYSRNNKINTFRYDAVELENRLFNECKKAYIISV